MIIIMRSEEDDDDYMRSEEDDYVMLSICPPPASTVISAAAVTGCVTDVFMHLLAECILYSVHCPLCPLSSLTRCHDTGGSRNLSTHTTNNRESASLLR